MKDDLKHEFDLSIPRRRYYSKDCGLTSCPECGLPLIKDNCAVIIAAKSDTDEAEFMSNLNGSHFCSSCPVVVFDSETLESAVRIGIKGDNNVRFLIAGIVNFKAIPEDKRHHALGIEENPMPIVPFLPGLNKTTVVNKQKKLGRNDSCPCGSGKKYKRCCGMGLE